MYLHNFSIKNQRNYEVKHSEFFLYPYVLAITFERYNYIISYSNNLDHFSINYDTHIVDTEIALNEKITFKEIVIYFIFQNLNKKF